MKYIIAQNLSSLCEPAVNNQATRDGYVYEGLKNVIHHCICTQTQRNISSIFSGNSEDFASELPENVYIKSVLKTDGYMTFVIKIFRLALKGLINT